MERSNKMYTLITGGSSGLGLAIALECASRGMNLILCALPQSNLPTIASQIIKKYNVDVKTIEIDLADTTQYFQLEEIKEKCRINFLVNNAGIGMTSNLMETPLSTIDKVIQVNVKAFTMVTRLMVPEMIKNSKSYVLNVSSFAAFSHMAYKTVYPASKAFVNSFSMSLREEMKGKNLSVTVFNPGPIATNFDTSRRLIKQGFAGRIVALPVKKIAQIAVEATLKEKKIVVPGFFNKLNYWLLYFLPVSLCSSITSRVTQRELRLGVRRNEI